MQLITTARQTAAKKHTSVATRLDWVLWGISLVLAALGVLLVVLNAHSSVDVFDYWIESSVSVLVFSPIGAVILAHRSRHFIGWIFCAIGLVIFVSALIIAVLFAPLRRRIEAFLSRSALRREDAEGTHTALSNRLREEADLGARADEDSIRESEDTGVSPRLHL